MRSKPSQAILLFDVMDTLVRDPFFDVVPGFFGMDLPSLLAQKHPTAWIEFEMGQVSPRQYYERMFADCRPFDHAAFEAAVKAGYEYIEGVELLLRDLSAHGHAMHALSNYPVWYRWIEERLELSRYVKWSFVSCKTKVRKPDPRAYVGAATALGCAPEACLFIDDRHGNCEAAEAVGMRVVTFENAAQLRRELADRGLL